MSNIPPLEISHSCLTCKFSRFHNQSRGDCLAFVPNNKSPEVPRLKNQVWYPFDLFNALMYGKDKWGRELEVPNISEYVKAGMDYLALRTNNPQQQAMIDAFDTYFREMEAYVTWWKTYGDDVRYIHKNTLCSAWEDGNMRDSIARGVIKRNGKRTKCSI